MGCRVKVDGRDVEVDAGATLMDAARKAGVEVPAMCYLFGYEHQTSCMICMVRDTASGRLIPSCSAPAWDGAEIETAGPEVIESRKAALELLLSEHVGDCEGPCRMACPARMDIPLMIRLIGEERLTEAIAVVKRDIPFPAVLGRICPAPCEKVCRRSAHDESVSICLLKRFVADADLATGVAYVPEAKPSTGRDVAVVGAGPAGLSAAYYLCADGHGCEVIDENQEPGGGMRHGIPRETLPGDVLDREIDAVRRLGATFRTNTRVGLDVSMDELAKKFDAVVIAAGEATPELARDHPAIHPVKVSSGSVRMAVRALAYGRAAAYAVDRFLRGQEVTGPPRMFNSRMGALLEGEIDLFMADADPRARVEPAGGPGAGFAPAEAAAEAARCLRCDCAAKDTCTLKAYAEEYDAAARTYRSEERKRFERITQHASVVYEPGKCIKCGLCVRITERAGERLGLTFIGRGFDVRVGVPFDESLADALEKTAEECARACPTGALVLKS